MNALELRDICKRYEDFTLDHVSFSVPMGSIMGLIGENGAGKSTTINLVLGLIGLDSGEIAVLGENGPAVSPKVKAQLGVVLDEAGFPDCMTARQVGKMLRLAYPNWQQKTYDGYLARFGLPPQKPLKDYSRGMKMKLGIAAALSHDAKLLILDEATSGLDPVVRDEIIDMLLEFIQDEQHAVLLSSHITSDLEKVCDYVTFIHRGKVLYSEEKDALLERMCILKCTQEQLKDIDRRAIHGVRRGAFGVEALAERDRLPDGCVTDRATLDDIIVYVAKGERK